MSELELDVKVNCKKEMCSMCACWTDGPGFSTGSGVQATEARGVDGGPGGSAPGGWRSGRVQLTSERKGTSQKCEARLRRGVDQGAAGVPLTSHLLSIPPSTLAMIYGSES